MSAHPQPVCTKRLVGVINTSTDIARMFPNELRDGEIVVELEDIFRDNSLDMAIERLRTLLKEDRDIELVFKMILSNAYRAGKTMR